MKKLLVLLIVLATLVCICACQKKPVEDPVIQPQTQPTDPTIPVQTVDPIMVQMQKLLENKDKFDLYNYALLSEFSSPEDVNLYNLFAYGFKDESKNPTQQEIDLMGSWIWDDRSDLRRLPVEKMNAALTEVFGITLDQTNMVGMDRMWYFEETDCYYGYLYSGETAAVNVRRVDEQDDGTLKVYYRRGRGNYQDMIVTLKPAGESYQILSNVYYSPMLGEMQHLLDRRSVYPFYNDALYSFYTKPADVDLFYLFYNGFKDESQSPTEQEEKLLDGKLGQHWKEMDLIRLPVDKMDAVLTDLFGITLEDTNGVGLSNFVYLEETDCYYHTVTGASGVNVTVVYTERLEDGSIMVQYSAGYSGNRMAKLMLTEDGVYRILSNVEIDHLYNETGIYNTVVDYFERREAYLKETSAEMNNINPGVLADEAAHLAAIHAVAAELVSSEVTIVVGGYWDSHAEASVTETVTYNKNGTEVTEIVFHKLQLGLLDDGSIYVVSDGYQENTTRFTSASYVAE